MSYKEKARAYFTAVNNYDVSTIEQMVDENYIQHNPFVPTGRAAFLALIPKLKQHGTKIINLRMMEDRQHVIMHHRWENAAPFGFKNTVAFHIVRFDDQSKVAEHWSVMMEDSLIDWKSRELKYRKHHKTFRERSFVLSVWEGDVGGVPSAIYDLYRFDREITAEHWRIAQAIPAEGSANSNTMFGFR